MLGLKMELGEFFSGYWRLLFTTLIPTLEIIENGSDQHPGSIIPRTLVPRSWKPISRIYLTTISVMPIDQF